MSHRSSLLYLFYMNFKINRITPYLRLVSCLVFLALIFLALELSGLRSEFTILKIQLLFKDNLITGSFLFILAFSVGNIAGIPGWIFLAASIYALGKTNGYLVTTSAALVSSVVSFYLVRFIGQDSLRKIEHPMAIKLLSKLDKSPLKVNILLRILFQTLPPLNYSLALSGVAFKDYFLGALLGLPIPILIITLLFDQFIQLIN